MAGERTLYRAMDADPYGFDRGVRVKVHEVVVVRETDKRLYFSERSEATGHYGQLSKTHPVAKSLHDSPAKALRAFIHNRTELTVDMEKTAARNRKLIELAVKMVAKL